MTNLKFINRAEELRFLEEKYDEGSGQLIVIYGRRRVGKSELILQLAKDKPYIYFLSDKRGSRSNAIRFSSRCAQYFGDPAPEYLEFDDAFRYLASRAAGKRLIVAIDEFSYLAEKDPAIPSVFQLCWDEILKDSGIMLILCGSSVSMMIKGALSRESPLYGRRSGQWKVMPLGFRHVKRFFPKKSLEEAIGLYSVTGGVPEYILKMDPALGLNENIVKKVLSKGEVLYQEVDFLLQEELRDPSTYKSILSAMARSAKVTDIANKAGIPATDMPKYLNVLQKIELVERELPVTQTRSKKSSYRIKDNFFKFWFRVAFPNLSELEEGKGREILKKQEPSLRRHIADTFEKVCHEAVVISQGLKYNKIGRWWGSYREEGERKVQEIDIVGLDEKERSVLFAECKFEHKVDAEEVLDQLKGKAGLVDWKRKEERYAIFAKSFSRRVDEKGIALYDMNDLERIFEKG